MFLPQYSPDLNPIEMAFAKIKALLRTAATRTFEALWAALGDICALFSPDECWNFVKEAGDASGSTHAAVEHFRLNLDRIRRL